MLITFRSNYGDACISAPACSADGGAYCGHGMILKAGFCRRAEFMLKSLGNTRHILKQELKLASTTGRWMIKGQTKKPGLCFSSRGRSDPLQTEGGNQHKGG